MRIYISLRNVFFTVAVLFIVRNILVQFRRTLNYSANIIPSQYKDTITQKGDGQHTSKIFKITWLNPPVFLTYRPDAMFSGFYGCIYDNCKMSYINTDARQSDAVIFTGRLIPVQLPFTRPRGQVWIFYEHEPPYRWSEQSMMWNQSNVFNWTMTYDRSIADIHLPYGEIRAKSGQYNTNNQNVMRKKSKTALLIMSHCDTPAMRLRYIEVLQKYIEVDVLGQCGTKWSCGRRFIHDDCFGLINSYKFYLAFENSFCSNYFSEKIFENFDYDTVLVSRGGLKGQSGHILPEGTFIQADNFKNAKELGNYLNSMSNETYLDILMRKNQYTSLNSYHSVFHNAMCELCHRMNNLEKFERTISDMNRWAFSFEPCKQPSDFE